MHVKNACHNHFKMHVKLHVKNACNMHFKMHVKNACNMHLKMHERKLKDCSKIGPSQHAQISPTQQPNNSLKLTAVIFYKSLFNFFPRKIRVNHAYFSLFKLV